MTAQEAKEWGFITDIKEPVQIDQETAIILQQDTNNIVIETVDGLYIYSYQYMSEIEYQGKFDSKVLSK